MENQRGHMGLEMFRRLINHLHSIVVIIGIIYEQCTKNKIFTVILKDRSSRWVSDILNVFSTKDQGRK